MNRPLLDRLRFGAARADNTQWRRRLGRQVSTGWADRGRIEAGAWRWLRWLSVPMKLMRPIITNWRLLSSALVAAAIVHIVVTLSASATGDAAAFRALSSGLPVNDVAFGKPVSATAQALPYLSPDALYAFCHFDASTSRIRVRAKLPEAGWSLSLHAPGGENFYYVPGSARQETHVELVLEPPGNVFAHGTIDISAANQTIPTVKLPDVRGLVILRAPIKGLAYRRLSDEQRATFKCEAQTTSAAR